MTDIQGEPIEEPIDVEKHWQKIGVHRSIASFWWNFIIFIFAAAPVLILVSYVLPNFILPFPEALGYRTLTITYFGLFFSIMDMATGPACERFVAQYAEINPQKALRYLSFFIYFQMFTGAIQVTGVAVFCFTVVVNTDLSYAIWFFIIYSLSQWPGMLAAYKSTLRAYQRFDKSNLVEIVQGVLIEVLTQIGFIFLGRWYGIQNPQLGELMGATIGFIIGREVDEIFAMLLSAYFVSKVLEPYGIPLRRTFVPTFMLQEAKESLWYGIKLLGATVISTATEFITLLMLIEWLPAYVMIMGLIEIAKMFADIVNMRYNFSAFVSEAYNNGKEKLTEYLVTQNLRHWWYFSFFLALQISILIPPVLDLIGGNFADAAWIVPIYVLPRLLIAPPVIGADLLQAVDRPEYRTFGIIVEKSVKMLTVFFFLGPWGFVQYLSLHGIIIFYVLHDIPAYIAITIAEFGLLHKKCVPVRIQWWQTFGAGTIASAPLIPVNLGIIALLNVIAERSPTLAGPIIFIAVVLFLLFLVFPAIIFFFYGFMGGWDDVSLKEFEDAVPLCGPSKGVVAFFFKFTDYGHQKSPWKNKFTIPHEEAYQEIAELTAMQYHRKKDEKQADQG